MSNNELQPIVEKAVKVKQKRNRQDLQNFGAENMQPGDNTRYLRFTRIVAALLPIDIADPAQVQSRIDWYFNHCEESDLRPTVNGFCNALGICRNTLNTWRNGEFRQGTHQYIIKRAYSQLAELYEMSLIHNKGNPVAAIFAGKNFFDMQDKCEYVLTPNSPLGIAEDPEEIRQRYLADGSED